MSLQGVLEEMIQKYSLEAHSLQWMHEKLQIYDFFALSAVNYITESICQEPEFYDILLTLGLQRWIRVWRTRCVQGMWGHHSQTQGLIFERCCVEPGVEFHDPYGSFPTQNIL